MTPAKSTKPRESAERVLDIAPVGHITVKAAAELLGCSVQAIRSWYRAGKITSVLVKGKAGAERWVSEDEVRATAATTTIGRPRGTGTSIIRASDYEAMSAKWQAEVERRAEAEKRADVLAFKAEQAERRIEELEERLRHRRWLRKG